MKYSPEQSMSDVGAGRALSRETAEDRVRRHHPAVGVVCPGCGARIGKPCTATVRAFGVGTIGTPIEGVHVERVAAAREQAEREQGAV